MNDVFFLPASAAEDPAALGIKVRRLYATLPFASSLPAGALVAVKLHFGEPGRPAPIPPAWVRPVVDSLSAAGAQPFLTDTCTLYRGGRSHAVVHLRTAASRGYTLAQAGAPVVIADGLLGEDSVEVPIAGRHFQSVAVAGAAARASALLVFSHFTGHMGASFGAALKTIGMGLAARAGKLRQHAAATPRIDPARCGGCGECVAVCPEGAIDHDAHRAVIDPERCSGCGQCVTVCHLEAVRADYGAHTRALQERIAEHALGALHGKAGRLACVTFLLNVTANCDCLGFAEPPLFPDLGLLASVDPVAADQAACDLVRERTGRPIHAWCGRDLDPRWQLEHAEALGVGSRRYRLRELSPADSD